MPIAMMGMTLPMRFHATTARRPPARLLRPPVVPVAVRREDVVADRPLAEGIACQGAKELVAAHADVAGARWDRSGFDAHAALQQSRIVAADAVDHLGDLVQRDGPRS